MSWLPIEKLTKEEKDIIQDFNKKKTTLHGKYHQQIKDLDTTHETWIGNFSSQHKKKLQKCQELYKVDQHKIDKTEYSTDELQAYAVYKLAVDTYKNTKEKVTEKYTKDLEVLNLELDKISKEINKNLQERETEEYFDLYHKDHKEVMNYVSTQVNQRLKQQQGNTELVDRNVTDEDNQELSKVKGKDHYPWLDKEDPRRKMTDQEILEKYIDLSDSDLDQAEKRKFV